MKKLFACFVFFMLFATANAQFFQGWGFFVGGTAGRQKWSTQANEGNPKQKFLLRYNAEVFGEFGSHPTFRWVSELQYNVKGTRYEVNGNKVKYANQYAAWNNYL